MPGGELYRTKGMIVPRSVYSVYGKAPTRQLDGASVAVSESCHTGNGHTGKQIHYFDAVINTQKKYA